MKKILIIGSNSFVAKAFVEATKETSMYDFYLSNRESDNAFCLDVTSEDSINNIDFGAHCFDAILFLQGINPSKNLEDSDMDHFIKMYKVNIAGPSQIIKKLIPNLNKDASLIFINSIASIKGSYDPSYAASKSALNGFIHSLTRAYSQFRFNSIMLGLVENSPVYNGMSEDFREKHASKMYGNKFIQVENVIRVISDLIENSNINNSCIPLHGGFQN